MTGCLEDECEGNDGWAERPSDPAAGVESQATRAVSALAREQQLILVFRYYSQRSLAEAAEDLGVSREHVLSCRRTLSARCIRLCSPRHQGKASPERYRNSVLHPSYLHQRTESYIWLHRAAAAAQRAAPGWPGTAPDHA